MAQFEARKREHILHALDPAHQASGLGGLDRVRLLHEALPELNFEDVRLETSCLGRPLATPFYVAGMTAGHPDASQINRIIARTCQKRGWAFGVGSQRRELESSGAAVDEWIRLREESPELVIFANLGLSQVIDAQIKSIQAVIQALGANALAVHANSLQEALQPEGTPRFKGSMDALRRLCSELRVPVVLKETGCGFSAATLARLKDCGLAAIDVSGVGGTHWGRIEGARAPGDSLHARAAATFANWGESTVDSVWEAAKVFPSGSSTDIWASGGVRSGLDAAKLIALGASRVGYAKPALEAALKGELDLDQWMALQEFELRVALFCTGSRTTDDLKRGARLSFTQTRA